MQALFTLIRTPNLFIVVLTQCLLYFRLIAPSLQKAGVQRNLDDAQFGVLVLITVLITASGYIINDIIDYPADLINKPEKVIIYRKISLPVAYWLYFSFNLLGYILALYLAFVIHHLPYLILFPIAVSGLYLYSRFLKSRPLWGNLLVAFYCAGVAVVLLLAEKEGLQQLYDQDQKAVAYLGILFLWYAVFAFLSTLYRELIKDLQDEIGDREKGLRTAPVVWGKNNTKKVAFGIGGVLLLFIATWSVSFYEHFRLITWSVLGVGVSLPLIYTLGVLLRAESSSDFYCLSQIAKWIMLGGILMLFFF